MLHAFSKGVSQLGDAKIRKVIWFSIAAAGSVFALLWLAVGAMLGATTVFMSGWLEWTVDLLGGLATLVVTWFLFPAVISAIIGIFLEDIAEAVEARHYPALPPAAGLPVAKAAITVAAYLGVMIALNMVLLILDRKSVV